MKRARNKTSAVRDSAKVRKILNYYEHQTEDAAASEIETAEEAPRVAWIEVPAELVPQVRRLIAKHKKSA